MTYGRHNEIKLLNSPNGHEPTIYDEQGNKVEGIEQEETPKHPKELETGYIKANTSFAYFGTAIMISTPHGQVIAVCPNTDAIDHVFESLHADCTVDESKLKKVAIIKDSHRIGK